MRRIILFRVLIASLVFVHCTSISYAADLSFHLPNGPTVYPPTPYEFRISPMIKARLEIVDTWSLKLLNGYGEDVNIETGMVRVVLRENTVDFAGDGFISFAISNEILKRLSNPHVTKMMYIPNSMVNKILDSVVNNTDVVEAEHYKLQDGNIILY